MCVQVSLYVEEVVGMGGPVWRQRACALRAPRWAGKPPWFFPAVYWWLPAWDLTHPTRPPVEKARHSTLQVRTWQLELSHLSKVTCGEAGFLYPARRSAPPTAAPAATWGMSEDSQGHHGVQE